MEELVMFGGIGLVIANGITSGTLKSFWNLISNKAEDTKTHSHLLIFGGEFLFIFILAAIAHTSSNAANMSALLILALWTVWGVTNPPQIGGLIDALTTE